ncbi:MAG: hypothetical protein HC802_04415 [Caldilineaceae bacterium]|nr:hypothetical protein [Caldilineaceae bacterium]
MSLFRFVGPRQALTAVQQAAEGSKRTLQQIREVSDPRLIAAGFVGLAAGEVVGGAVGGLVGIVVAGPAGAVVGGQVGAFTVGMVGLKLGTEAMHNRLQAGKTKPGSQPEKGKPLSLASFLGKKTGERAGEIAGLTSGAALGMVVAGPAGGLVGAIIGEAVGGQLGEDVTRARATSDGKLRFASQTSISRWLDNLGKNTVGESSRRPGWRHHRVGLWAERSGDWAAHRHHRRQTRCVAHAGQWVRSNGWRRGRPIARKWSGGRRDGPRGEQRREWRRSYRRNGCADQ